MKLHERARELVLLRDVEGLSDSDSAWLEQHLAECEECTEFSVSLEMTARALRLTPVMADPALVTTTQARVRQRAAELRERDARVFLIGISFCIGIVWSVASALVGWKLSGWLGDTLHLPAWLIAGGLVVFWLAPAIAVGLVFLNNPRPMWNHGERTSWGMVEGQGEWR